MGYFPLTATGKALGVASSAANARTSALAITAAADSMLDDSTTDLILATLGGGTTGIAVFKDATAADVRTDIGAGVGYTVEAKNADFTAADGKFYEIDASGTQIDVTMFSCAVGAQVGFKMVVGGNNIVINRIITEDIDNAPAYTLTTVNEAIEFIANAAGTEWLVK